MKLARISSLLFVPLALCAAVPQQVDVYEINDNIVSIANYYYTTV
jgi:hypothetical protein